jgi:hypothetical protein
MNWWDSMGGSGSQYRGAFDGTILRLSAPLPQGGHSRASWNFDSAGAYSFNMEISSDGHTWQPAMLGTYTRATKKSASRKSTGPAAKTARGAARSRKPASSKRSSGGGKKAKER